MDIGTNLVSRIRAVGCKLPLGIVQFCTVFFATAAVFAGDDESAKPVEAFGQTRYVESCAACHGMDGKGNGPVANLLTQKPSDITLLAKNNAGVFPFMRIYDVIDGREGTGAHGTREMPIWGAEWKAGRRSEPNPIGETVLRGRILELIVYLRSIQQ